MLFSELKSSQQELSFCLLFLYTDWDTGYSPCRGGHFPVTHWLGHPPGVGMLENIICRESIK